MYTNDSKRCSTRVLSLEFLIGRNKSKEDFDFWRIVLLHHPHIYGLMVAGNIFLYRINFSLANTAVWKKQQNIINPYFRSPSGIFNLNQYSIETGVYYCISSNKRRGAYLIFVILGAALIRGWRLKDGGAYFEF